MNSTSKTLRIVLLSTVVALLAAGCTPGDTEAAESTASPTSSASTPATTTPAPSPSITPEPSVEPEPSATVSNNVFDDQALNDLLYFGTGNEWPDDVYTTVTDGQSSDRLPGVPFYEWALEPTSGGMGTCNSELQALVNTPVIEAMTAGPENTEDYLGLWGLARMESPEAAQAVVENASSVGAACVAEYPWDGMDAPMPVLFMPLSAAGSFDEFVGAEGFMIGVDSNHAAYTMYAACGEIVVWAGAPDSLALHPTSEIWQTQLAQLGCSV
ncbi:hypothetical protein [Humidisolicoccus flavus]|uniref:hypothetical protein n=1 Tax=Humidisolicoccus flavus TaxID=3111414 RepID=UPI0032519236